MAYTIRNNDGTVLARVADASINSTATSLTFVGRDYTGYGQYYNQDLVTLLTNSALPTPPLYPINGQLWYDTTSNRLKIYNGSFVSVSAAYQSGNLPVNLPVGDFWYNSSAKVLNYKIPTLSFVTVSTYPTGETTGWIVPATGTIVDNTAPSGVEKTPVTLIYNQDPSSAIGAYSQYTFTASAATTSAYFSAAGQTNYSLVNGLNIIGNIQASGSIVIATSTPATSSAAGIVGQISWDSSYLYVCVATNTWKRAALTSW